MNILKRIVTLIGLIALVVIAWFVFQKDDEPVTTVDFSNQIPNEERDVLEGKDASEGVITNVEITPQGEVRLTLNVYDVIPGDSPEYVINGIETRIKDGDTSAIPTLMSIVGDDFRSYDEFITHIRGMSIEEFHVLQKHYFEVSLEKGIVSDLLSSHPSGGGSRKNLREGLVYKVAPSVKDIVLSISEVSIPWIQYRDTCMSEDTSKRFFHVRDMGGYSCDNPVKFTVVNGIITRIEMLYQS